MRNNQLLSLSIIIVFFGCSNELDQSRPLLWTKSTNAPTSYQCNMDFSFKVEDLDTLFFVSKEDINCYLKFLSLNLHKDVIVNNIEAFDYKGATLFYIINYENGWEVISSDKRTPYLLAKGDSGFFSMKNYESTPWGTWMFTVALDVLNTRINGRNVSSEEDEDLKFWTLITEPEKIVSPLTKSISTQGPIELSGHYELTSTYTQSNYDVRAVSHLISTKWSQNGNDCNYYVPFRTDYPNLKAPAGCVAISGAQMLYFLHYKLGVPQAIPDSAYCNGNINSYQMWQSGSSSSIWGRMSIHGDTLVAILIANVGSLIGMEYGNQRSSANTSDLVNNFFSNYGISCSYGPYNIDAIRAQLINRGIPIVVRASSLVPFDTWLSGHSFIVDGCQYTRDKTTYTYSWVYDVEPEGDMLMPTPPDSYTVETFSYNSTELIQMNWGWDGCHDDEYFSPGGDWEINDNGRYNYQYNRNMIYGFIND